MGPVIRIKWLFKDHIYYIICARHCAEYFSFIVSFNFQNSVCEAGAFTFIILQARNPMLREVNYLAEEGK